jgi:hypothetical protein
VSEEDPVLAAAWRQFATYDRHAIRAQRTYRWTRVAALAIGVIATALALWRDAIGKHVGWLGIDWLHWSVVVLPIALSGLAAFVALQSPGARWILLRGAAETLKSEIFRYRTSTKPYEGEVRGKALRAAAGRTAKALSQSSVTNGDMRPYEGPLPPPKTLAEGDDGFSALDSGRYLELRIGDQRGFYRRKAGTLNERRLILRIAGIVAAAAGAIVAAAGVEVWVGLTTAIGAAVAAYLADLQFDSTIVGYNRTADILDDLVLQWPERGDDLAGLVDDAEVAMLTELGGWVQQMDEAIRRQAKRDADDKKGE